MPWQGREAARNRAASRVGRACAWSRRRGGPSFPAHPPPQLPPKRRMSSSASSSPPDASPRGARTSHARAPCMGLSTSLLLHRASGCAGFWLEAGVLPPLDDDAAMLAQLGRVRCCADDAAALPNGCWLPGACLRPVLRCGSPGMGGKAPALAAATADARACGASAVGFLRCSELGTESLPGRLSPPASEGLALIGGCTECKELLRDRGAAAPSPSSLQSCFERARQVRRQAS
jgi:hypothetical protein